MTLTVVVGSSGSGKTTFLDDCHKHHKCIYLRQYHSARPYIRVASIPNFDPKQLPFWDIYEREGKANTIPVGGTMAGEFVEGLSGGQRKLLLFEIVRQRVASQENLLICLDEPFAGVTDDFVPFIEERLKELTIKHNIVLVTNDHIQALTDMADNQITVSAIDRTTVRINDRPAVDRNKALAALSVGHNFQYHTGFGDLLFFFDVEVWSNKSLLGVAVFALFMFAMFLCTFWDSDPSSAALILIAGEIIAYFSLNPYLLSAVDWRNYMKEEAEALMHASTTTNLFLRTVLTVVFSMLISLMEFGIVNATVDGLAFFDVWYAITFDNLSSTLPFIWMGLFTSATSQDVEVVGSLPYLFMLFLSSAYSPGAGVPVLKELRYLFPKFYFWCFVPGVEDQMEGCPSTRGATLGLLAISTFTFNFIFFVVHFFNKCISKKGKKLDLVQLLDVDMQELQMELYGEDGRHHFQRLKSALTMPN